MGAARGVGGMMKGVAMITLDGNSLACGHESLWDPFGLTDGLTQQYSCVDEAPVRCLG